MVTTLVAVWDLVKFYHCFWTKLHWSFELGNCFNCLLYDPVSLLKVGNKFLPGLYGIAVQLYFHKFLNFFIFNFFWFIFKEKNASTELQTRTWTTVKHKILLCSWSFTGNCHYSNSLSGSKLIIFNQWYLSCHIAGIAFFVQKLWAYVVIDGRFFQNA